MNSENFYTTEMKMADLILADYRLLLLLPRFDIDLGIGDKTIQTICEERGISPAFFLMICNIYSFENYFPKKEEIRKLDVNRLIVYLQRSHRYYLDNRLAAISQEMHAVIEQSQKAHGDILSRFFDEYKKELINHFDYEEKVVFPYVLGLANGNHSVDYQIANFEDNHTNIEDKLGDLKNILIKYLPGKTMQEGRMVLLFNLFNFEEDLDKHTLLEELILIPKVRNMEDYEEE